MKLFGWLLLVGGSLMSVANAFMLIMQAALWLNGHRSSWPPMGLSVYWGAKLKTGWVGIDMLFNGQIPTAVMIVAGLTGLLLAILGTKAIDDNSMSRLQNNEGAMLEGLTRTQKILAMLTLVTLALLTLWGAYAAIQMTPGANSISRPRIS